MTLLPRVGTLLLVFTTAVVAGAAADPIAIDSGSATSIFLGGRVDIASSTRGFTLVGTGEEGGWWPGWSCLRGSDCAAGSPQSLQAQFSGNDFPGTVTIDGSTYQVGTISEGVGFAEARFLGSWTAPTFTGAASATVVAPFQFTGRFIYPPSPGLPFSEERLTGNGRATIRLTSAPPGLGQGWVFDSVRYDFGASSPVPEPGTMLLVGAGAAALVRRRHAGPT